MQGRPLRSPFAARAGASLSLSGNCIAALCHDRISNSTVFDDGIANADERGKFCCPFKPFVCLLHFFFFFGRNFLHIFHCLCKSARVGTCKNRRGFNRCCHNYLFLNHFFYSTAKIQDSLLFTKSHKYAIRPYSPSSSFAPPPLPFFDFFAPPPLAFAAAILAFTMAS